MSWQWFQTPAGDVVERSQLLQLGGKGVFVVEGGRAVAGHRISARLVHHDLAAGVNHARAELDGREVSLADCPQAHDESLFPWIQPGLIGSWDHRRIAEGSRLDGVLLSEVGADEEPAFLGKISRVVNVVGHHREVALENAAETCVPVCELVLGGRQRGRYLALWHVQDPFDDELDSRPPVREDLLPR